MKPILSHPLRLADLPQRKVTHVRLVPDAGQLEALADRLDVDGFRKVRLEGELRPGPGRDWMFEGILGATILQPCRVTTEPVTTRVDEPVRRRYTPDFDAPTGEEVEMPEDDSVEPLPSVLDMGDVLEEALALATPDFPRAPAADGLELEAAPPGVEPLKDETVKPFAGLADLKARMERDE
ncbi:DUF177 domain-containing protein [Jannaschia sp. S6380]|uniref:YceD family protein n=1 Tax=Jannaschia sp. S6380 TaxID=2926408 RepID=UPI001FF49D70|nr:DUF177 domain-containing protein [Jannaschia sp. S6380]MCK0166117.1 DUF177 domain-containing protein [Jannaschia sp. S6380]